MALALRSPLARLSTALLGAAALAVMAPSAGEARDWDDHRGGHYRRADHPQMWHRKHHSHPRHHGHHGHSYGRPYCDYRGHGDYEEHYVVRRPAHYYCDPCGHGYRSRRALYDHVHHHHHVPYVRIPSLVVHVGLDWVFGF